MNVWIRKTRKRVLCKHCEKFIESGEYQVVCQYFMKLRGDRTWRKVMHFHAKDPYCWVERAVAEIDTRPVVELRGRKANHISDEHRVIRLRMLRRRASVMQRINNEMEGKQRPAVLSHLADLLDKLTEEIEPYGGVPESWK